MKFKSLYLLFFSLSSLLLAMEQEFPAKRKIEGEAEETKRPKIETVVVEEKKPTWIEITTQDGGKFRVLEDVLNISEVFKATLKYHRERIAQLQQKTEEQVEPPLRYLLQPGAENKLLLSDIDAATFTLLLRLMRAQYAGISFDQVISELQQEQAIPIKAHQTISGNELLQAYLLEAFKKSHEYQLTTIAKNSAAYLTASAENIQTLQNTVDPVWAEELFRYARLSAENALAFIQWGKTITEIYASTIKKIDQDLQAGTIVSQAAENLKKEHTKKAVAILNGIIDHLIDSYNIIKPLLPQIQKLLMPHKNILSFLLDKRKIDPAVANIGKKTFFDAHIVQDKIFLISRPAIKIYDITQKKVITEIPLEGEYDFHLFRFAVSHDAKKIVVCNRKSTSFAVLDDITKEPREFKIHKYPAPIDSIAWLTNTILLIADLNTKTQSKRAPQPMSNIISLFDVIHGNVIASIGLPEIYAPMFGSTIVVSPNERYFAIHPNHESERFVLYNIEPFDIWRLQREPETALSIGKVLLRGSSINKISFSSDSRVVVYQINDIASAYDIAKNETIRCKLLKPYLTTYVMAGIDLTNEYFIVQQSEPIVKFVDKNGCMETILSNDSTIKVMSAESKYMLVQNAQSGEFIIWNSELLNKRYYVKQLRDLFR